MSVPQYRLTMAADAAYEPETSAVLGVDIRADPKQIARHCLVEHRAISEDLATIAESVALADRLFPRHRATGWARSIAIQLPVFEQDVFRRNVVLEALVECLHFLTGDVWHFEFIRRCDRPLTEAALPFERVEYRFVAPYSDGLDSFAQAALLENEFGPRSVLKVRSARIGQDSRDLKRSVLRVPRSLGPRRKKEQSYRSRPFVFLAFAGIGALAAGAEAIVVGETGQGSMGPALVPYAGEWPFRSTHPGFLARMTDLLNLVLSYAVRCDQPQLWRTKGEVLGLLREKGLLGRWYETRSCSVRPLNRHGASGCGVCGGCVLRRLAIESAGLKEDGQSRAFDLHSLNAVDGHGAPMSSAERHMAVRSLSTVIEFARLSSGEHAPSRIESESMLFGVANPSSVSRNLKDLIHRHAAESAGMMARLPFNGWARDIVAQL